MNTKYQVTGMNCAACSARVEKAVNAVDGVQSCAVSLLTNSMQVAGDAPPDAVIAAVTAAGYGAALQSDNDEKNAEPPLRDTETPKLRRRLIASLIVLPVLMYCTMGHHMLGLPLPAFLADNPAAHGLMQLLLTSIVMVINQQFFISGFRAAVKRAPNMDTLVACGAFASFLWSVYVLFALSGAQLRGDAAAVSEYANQFYFESAAMILTLITVGKTLEAHAKGKTTDALHSLMQLAPKTAVIIENGTECEVPVSAVRQGMLFAVHPGAQIPADGMVREGSGAVDESALTGESIPVDKAAGDPVSAGTINRSGYLRCEATRTGEDTALAQIIRMVSDAAASKAPIAKTADKVAGIFVPAVMAVAAVTFTVWMLLGKTAGFALARAVSVLVISCPCSLGLATPVAIMVGSGVGAKCGILFKNAAALEETGRIRVVALDKTGTVTAGQPHVTDIMPVSGISKTQLLTEAAALEQHSEHPLAKAVMQAAEQAGITAPAVTDFSALTGSGVTAKLNGIPLLGCKEDTAAQHAEIPADMREKAKALSDAGRTPLFFLKDGTLTGMIAVADMIKPDSSDAIAKLKALGTEVVLLTGDNERTAAAVGKEAGVDRIIANVLPEGKEQIIRTLAEKGKVCMIGDGINDAPALTRADIGMAIGAGTDVAIDAADVVLMQSSLTDALNALRLSRKTLKNIRENLFWAFFYNVIGIPLAAGVLVPFGLTLSPMFGAAAMSLSSFCVVTNALRLNLFKPEKARPQAAVSAGNNEKGAVEIMAATLLIKGMMCPHCEAHVRKALGQMEGVTVVSVSHEEAKAVVETAEPIPEERFRAVIADAGYELTGIA